MKNIFKLNYLLYAVLTLFIFTACEEDEAAPEEENEVEVFTDVKLIFMAQSGTGDTVVVAAQDPDGAGVQELQVLGAINLAANTEYLLSMMIENCLEDPCELMNEEIEEEAEEHQFFFAFTNDILQVLLVMGISIMHQIQSIILVMMVMVILLDYTSTWTLVLQRVVHLLFSYSISLM